MSSATPPHAMNFQPVHHSYTMAIIHTMDHALCATVQLSPLRTPSWGCFKKVRIHVAVTGSHVTCRTLAWSHWAAMAAVGWCVGHVGGRGRGVQVALYGSSRFLDGPD